MFGRLLRASALALATMGVLAPAAAAKTLTFDGVPDYLTALDSRHNFYREKGVKVTPTAGLLAWENAHGTIHLDDAGTDLTSGLLFTMKRAFSVTSFSLVSLGYAFIEEPERFPRNIVVTGLSGGEVVAQRRFTLEDTAFDRQTITLGGKFSGLEGFIIELIYPTVGLCDAPCGHFDLDWLELEPAAVPLPASMTLMGAAGLGLWAIRRRRRT
jgi:hypothetical protein